MSGNLEKLVRFLDALKLSQDAASEGGQPPPTAAVPAGGSSDGVSSIAASVGSGIGQAVRSFPSSTEQFLEQTAAVASLASSITQQGQTLLSKREPGLSKRDRMAHCQTVASVAVSTCSGSSSSGGRAQDQSKLLSVAIETLLLLTDDPEPDVRMTSDEALNRIVRGVSSAQVAKVLVEQMKAKMKGSARLLRAALARFAVLAKHIRVQKSRAYMQTMVPLLCYFSTRPEESIHESVCTALCSICPALGHFANDNEIKHLLTSYQGNLSHSSPAVRRAAAHSLFVICKHCRKPAIFLGCLLALVLKMLLPPTKQTSSQAQVLGGLVCLRHIAPELWSLCPPGSDGSTDAGDVPHTYSVSLHQLLQVYQLSVHFCSSSDHNTVTASLELLRALLEHAPAALVTALVTPAGVPRHSIDPPDADSPAAAAATVPAPTNLTSRTSSCGSISNILAEEDLSLEPDSPAAPAVLMTADSLDEDGGSAPGTLRRQRPSSTPSCLKREDSSTREEEDKGGGPAAAVGDGTEDGSAGDGGGAAVQPLLPGGDGSDLYSSIEIGKLSEEDDAGIAFSSLSGVEEFAVALDGQQEQLVGSPRGDEGAAEQRGDGGPADPSATGPQMMVKGDIGSVGGSSVSGCYLVRLLCSRFLLAGHSGSLLGERAVRVSAKVLALNCLTKLLSWLPEMMLDTLFLDDQRQLHEDMELIQRVWDVSRYSSHSDPSVCAAAATLLGHYLRASVLNTVTHDTDQPCSAAPSPVSATDEQSPRHSTADAAAPNTAPAPLVPSHSITTSNSPVTVEAVLALLKQVLLSESAVTARGGVSGLRACLPTLLHCLPHPALLPLLPAIVATTRHPYWLMKVEVCELLCQLPLSYIDFLEQSYREAGSSSSSLSAEEGSSASLPAESEYVCPPDWGTTGVGGQFSHRVLRDALLPLLPDTDHRVRAAAVAAIARLLPQLLLEGCLYRCCLSSLSVPGYLLTSNMAPALPHNNSKYRYSSQQGCGSRSLLSSFPPYDALLLRYQQRTALEASCSDAPQQQPQQSPSHQHDTGGYQSLPHHTTANSERPDSSTLPLLELESLQETCLNDSLARVVHLLSTTVFVAQDRNMKAGCVQTLCELSERYPPVLHTDAWGCCGPANSSSGGGVPACLSLLHQLLSLASDAGLATDLTTHAAILTLACNLLPGIAVSELEQQPPPPPGRQQQPTFAAMGNTQCRSVCRDVLVHVSRVLSLYWHVLEDAPPSTRAASTLHADAASPLKRRARGEAGDRSSPASSPGGSSDTRLQDGDRGKSGSKSSSGYGNFAHLIQYCKLYEVIRSAYNNYKMSVCVVSEQRVSCVLRAALAGLCCLLEVLHTADILTPLEQLLQCCTAATLLLPQPAVNAAQQLVKCLFGSNLVSQWHTVRPSTTVAPAVAPASIHECAVQLPLQQLHAEIEQLQRAHLPGRGEESPSSSRRYHRPPQSARHALSSYIRLFEPLVIKALNLYTVSSSMSLQRSVLELLVCLVHIRVNYCLLDSNQIFLRYVIKQLENIEEGHLKSADVLIPSLFEFLVAVSYERQHSRSIITVPKIIQLCDGLLASGQPPLSHCVLALGPLVEELFVSGAGEAGVGGAGVATPPLLQQPPGSLGADAAELATKREVLACTLLRLAHYHQVVSLIGVMVRGARQQGGQRWREVSCEVAQVLLPLLAAQQINLHSLEAVSAVLDVLCSLCPSVYSPPDALLKALLTSPYALESTGSVEVWVASVVVVVRLMVVRCSASSILSRLTQLGLTMQYISPEGAPPSPSSPTPSVATTSFANFSSPIRRKMPASHLKASVDGPNTAVGDGPLTLEKVCPSKAEGLVSSSVSEEQEACGDGLGGCRAAAAEPLRRRSAAASPVLSPAVEVATPQPALSDPLNVTQPTIKPETAIARFLLEVLRVCSSEVRSVWYLRCQAGGSDQQGAGPLPQDETLLAHLAHQLLLLLLWMQEQEEWRGIVSALRVMCSSSNGGDGGVLVEVSECLVSVRTEHPALSLLCARLHTLLDLPALHLWPHLLRSLQRKTPVTTPNASSGVLASPPSVGPSPCLALQYLRQSALLLFAPYVTDHLCEEEWLAWVLVQHTSDVVQLQQEPAVLHLLHAVHASAAASALLLHALNTRAYTQLQKPELGDALLSTVSNVHASQSGTLVLFLLQEMLTRPHFLHVSAAVCCVLRHRLHLLLSPPATQALQQVTQLHLKPYTTGGQFAAVVRRRCVDVSSLLEQLVQRVSVGEEECSAAASSHLPQPPTQHQPHALDLAWYLKLVTNRCSRDGGGSAEECSELLLHLEQPDLLTVMKGDTFSMALLQHTLLYGLQATLRNTGSGGKSASPPVSGNSSPNSNRSNSSNTSSVSSGSSNSSTSGGEHPLYSTSKLLLLHNITNIVAMLPKPHYDYRPGGGNKYSERVNQLLSEGRVGDAGAPLLRQQLEQLAPACSLYLTSLSLLPWRANVQAAHAHSLIRFALLSAEYLQWCVHEGSGSVYRVSVCLNCIDAVLSSLTLGQRLALPDYTAYVCSLVAALHLTLTYITAPAPLPRLSPSLWESVSSSGSVAAAAAGRLMQLVLWLEQGAHATIPPHVAAPIRGAVMALGRCPSLNAIVRCPPELWVAGWRPSISAPSQLPPIPAHLLLDAQVLKQLIFRIQLFGWLNRQQFEETWMALLSVLNTGGMEVTEAHPQDSSYMDQSVCLCIRGLSGLLRQTLLLPTPGNPHTALHGHTAPTYSRSRYRKAGALGNVVQLLRERECWKQHLTAAAPSTALMAPYTQHLLPVHAIAAALTTNTQHDDYDGSSSPYEGSAERSSQLAAMGIDLQSCTHFLQDLFAVWLTPEKGMCSSIVCEVAKCLSVMVDILTSAEHQLWVAEACVTLHSTHPVEDHITHHYLVLAAAKALAVCRAAQLSIGSATSDGVLHMVDAGLKSVIVAARTCSLHAVLFLLQQPPHHGPLALAAATGAAPIPGSTAAATAEKGGALRLLQGGQLSRTALSALTSHIKSPAAADTPAQEPQDPFLATLLQMVGPYILRACDTRVSEGEAHSIVAWEVCLYLVDHYNHLTDASLPSTALQLALATAAAASTTPALLQQVLASIERILRVQLPELQSSATSEVSLKLVMDLVQHGPPAVARPALPLLLSLLYAANRRGTVATSHEDPEVLLQLMEKLGTLFERIKTGYLYEAWLLAALLSTCLLDLLPASQVLNKVIMEYISSQQPYPHLLAATLFKVFEGCMEESGEGLVQEWVLMSLGNFTRREPMSLAVWCITCFLVAASRNRHLRAAYASVLTWPAQLTQQQQYSTPERAKQHLHADQLQLFCLAAAHFAAALPSQHHKDKFREVFEDVATPGSPFYHMLQFLDNNKDLS